MVRRIYEGSSGDTRRNASGRTSVKWCVLDRRGPHITTKWGLIIPNINGIDAGLAGGGGRVCAEVIKALPNNVIRDIDWASEGALRARLKIMREAKKTRMWAEEENLDGVLNMLSIPPAPGPYVRAMYVHTSLWRRMGLPWYRPGLFRWWMRRQQTRHMEDCIVLANSMWVRDEFISHGIPAQTVYPPCNIAPACEVPPSGERRPGMISVGRLTPIKRHDWAARVAERVGCPCDIYGAGNPPPSGGYGGTSNIHINVPWETIDAASKTAKVIFSGCHVEDFGIAIVEGMARGAIPVVPDAYGFRETVPFDELRYTPEDLPGAAETTRRAITGEYDHLVPDIIRHAAQYNTDRFHTTLHACIHGSSRTL